MKNKCKIKRNLFFILSFLATFGPFIFYGIKAMIEGEPAQKFTLSIFSLVAVIIAVAGVLLKVHLRSVIWILLLGVYFCLDNLIGVILVVAICTILDELVFNPLYHRYSKKYSEIVSATAVFDERMGNE